MDDYRDKVVFITGAASGIGQELARQLVTLGAQVVLTDRDGEGCRLVAESLGQGAEAATLDVTRPEDFEKALDAA